MFPSLPGFILADEARFGSRRKESRDRLGESDWLFQVNRVPRRWNDDEARGRHCRGHCFALLQISQIERADDQERPDTDRAELSRERFHRASPHSAETVRQTSRITAQPLLAEGAAHV